MSQHLIGYGVTFFTFVVFDLIWLTAMVNRLYRPTLGDILGSSVNLAPAAAFYFLYPIGLMVFAVTPALRSFSPTTALAYGALFGFFSYATYNLTNYATLRNWTLQLTAIDMGWGTLLGALSAYVSYSVLTHFGFGVR